MAHIPPSKAALRPDAVGRPPAPVPGGMANEMSESDVAETITSILETIGAEWGSDEADDLVSMMEAGEDQVEALCTARITSFREGMVLTGNAGFTLRLKDGPEFQVTVVRSV